MNNQTTQTYTKIITNKTADNMILTVIHPI